MAGGLLVACAMLGVLEMPGGASTTGTVRLVAAVDIAAGNPVGPNDVTSVPLDLPGIAGERALTPETSLDDRVARVTIPAGTILTADHLRTASGGGSTGAEATVSLPVTAALGGSLLVGDRVDVVATYGSGFDGRTTVEATGALVTAVSSGADTLGVEPRLMIGLRLREHDDLLAVVHASQADALTLVRASGGAGDREAFTP
jgi:Flp pilus assembly protein CpaB